MPYEPMTFAGVEVTPLCDAVGPMGPSIARPLPELFPGGSFADGEEWILHFHCFLLRTGAHTILVDTGVGDLTGPAAGWAPIPGRLLQELDAVGVAPADVDTVILTHLHSDHVSGCVAEGVPVFPNARHVIQEAELDWPGGGLMRDRIVKPLGDQLWIVHGSRDLFENVRVAHTPGHTPGHQVVLVGDLIVSGDVLHHPVQLADPTIGYHYDDDPERALTSRQVVLGRAAYLATSHLAEPFTKVR
ncbi:MBL fold metallo-hydrolase [Herbidospora sp. NEAU-GS84]|uniref:MBL fold metallo-hydrolase n=1 Tax=Herbidospora solisilvae TaxID=2696284 RepID=A0A7C9NGE9_9ACTN|nr:MBL fold metallo-hydrolase [Herbidospora solisilvae]NAS22358.1 MBL fold metallo-hydrolase [Herbidospora solisilvae]